MFAYPQSAASFILVACLRDPEVYRHCADSQLQLGDFDLQLGLVSEAEHWAHEALELDGDHPALLLRLARTYVAKGQTATARMCLRGLSRDLWHRQKAEGLLRQLETDPLLSADPESRYVRSVMLTDDLPGLGLSFEDSCQALLRRNPHNRMAFEYLMANYLLTRELGKLVANLGRLDDFHCPALPRHYEEAVLLYQDETHQTVDLHGRIVSADALQRYGDYCRLLSPFARSGDIQGARATLAPRHGRSYYFYYTFGESGAWQ
jgi:tetratricopeptide (TPR) repeat protein